MRTLLQKTGFITVIFLLSLTNILKATLPDGSIAPDFTITDQFGVTHNLQNDLDNGYLVIIDFFATWCQPCWDAHTSGQYTTTYNNLGPNGTDEIKFYAIEVDPGTSASSLSGGSGSLGDWLTGTPYPMIDDGFLGGLANLYNVTAYPSLYAICPSGSTYHITSNNSNYNSIPDIQNFFCQGILQPPNDDWTNATPITISPDVNCTNVLTGTTVNSTTTAGQDPSCAVTSDVWYSFTGGNDSLRFETTLLDPALVAGYSVYTESGGVLSLVQCGGNTFTPIAGTNYLLLTTIGDPITGTFLESEFNICIHIINAPPNDDWTGAIPVSISPDNNCTNAVSGTTVEASTSSGQDPGCFFPLDIWYSFTGGSSDLIFETNNVSPFGYGVFSVYTESGGVLTLEACGVNTFTPVPGTSYLLNLLIADPTGTNAQMSSFDLCIRLSSPPPNDDWTGAIPVSISPDNSCTNTVSGTTVEATSSSGQDPGCPFPWDVWYSFTGGSSDLIFETSNISPSGYGLFSVYTESGGVLTLEACGVAAFTPVPGINYLLNLLIADPTGTNAQMSSFDLCIRLSSPPPNDDWTGAIPLSISPDNTCTNAVSGTTVDAWSSIGQDPGCPFPLDVWYSFTGGSSDLIFETSNISPSGYGVFSVYTESGGVLTLEACQVSTYTPVSGTDYLVNLLIVDPSFSYVIESSFDLCIYTLNLPSNDECINAIGLSPAATCSNPENINLLEATASSDPVSCDGYFTDDLWYSFIATNTDHQIQLNNASSVYDGVVIQLSEGSCGALTELQCYDTYYEGEVLTAAGLTIGSTYYIRVASWDVNPEPITFDICLIDQNISSCSPSLTLNGAPDASQTYSADDYIESTSQINAGSNGPVIYQAGDDYIELKIGFEADGAVDFTAEIEDCDPGN